MDEPGLRFEGLTLSPQKEMVRVFYKELWDRADKRLIPIIVHEDFTFRGSLGPTLGGHDQFAGYVEFVTEAFGTVHNRHSDNDRGRQSRQREDAIHGLHRKELFGVPPSGRHVWWTGMPIFTFEGAKVRDLFVLGDIHGLISRLKD